MNKRFSAIILVAGLIATSLSAREIHVSLNGNDNNDGSAGHPFRTINHAAQVALPGDVVTVHSGTYREWVNPARGGESDARRIVYRAATGEKVEIKGSELVSGWVREPSGIWKITLPNSFFGDYNPYRDPVFGDWFNDHGRIHHTGEVFLNGKSLYEKENLDKVIHPVADTNAKDPEGSTYAWHCESSEIHTTLWANFQQFDPNKEMVEISTRRTCFWPEKPGINYLTISGFHFSQAATQWAAPTAEQIGMVATHWNKGWIIENNTISDSKCSGITLGKERGTGHNVWSADVGNVYNDGNIHYIEVLFRVLRNGWNRQNTGSHVVRNNTIRNCEQAGICGSFGAAFSIIENNHIYDIWTKRQFSGAEIGGIKFHAAVDAIIRGNRIHHCGRGLWLDWMTQGTRVSGNLFYGHTSEDIFLEVNHGPFLVDNNILLSPTSIRNQSEGGAYVHNLVAGSIVTYPEPNRFTPYFLPHSTDVSALVTIYSGDDRFHNNIFIGTGNQDAPSDKAKHGLEGYNQARLPVWMSGNVYYNLARPSDKDTVYLLEPSFNPRLLLIESDGNGYLHIRLSESFFHHKTEPVTTQMLGVARIPKAPFDHPDGSPLKIATDFFGKMRDEANPTAGPFENPDPDKMTIVKLW